MKLTILGKYGPYPQDGNTACSGYLVEEGNVKILVDCGSGVLGRLKSMINLKELSAIYLTHLHFDHTSDILPLRYLLDDLGIKVKIITHITNTEYCNILLNHPKFDIININDTSNIDIGHLKLSFCKLEHPVVNHGIIIEGKVKLGITGDTIYCENVLNMARNCDYLLADCSKPIGFKGPHMSADKAISIVEQTNVTLFATHATPNKNTDHLFEKYPNIIPVEELKTYQL